jgi:hypothetical protein
MWRRAVPVWSDVSEDHIASIFTSCSYLFMLVPHSQILLPWRWRRYDPPKRQFTQELHGATTQKTALFIVTAMKTSNLTNWKKFHPVQPFSNHWRNWNLYLLHNSSKHIKYSSSIDGIHLNEKGLHISACLEVANFLTSGVWISRFNRKHSFAYRNLSGMSSSVDSETVEDWKNYWLFKEIEGYDLCDINNADEPGLFFSLQHSKTLASQGHCFHGGSKSINSGLPCSSRAVKMVVINYRCTTWKV